MKTGLARVFLLWIAVGVTSSVSLHARQLHSVLFWGIDKGLTDRHIKCLKEDEDGFIWIGTEQGLARFDGRSFVSFGHIQPGHVLTHTRINQLCYRAPYLWIATPVGVYTFNTKTYQVAQALLPVNGIRKVNQLVYSMAMLSSGSMLIGGEQGKLWLAKDPQTVIEVPNQTGLDMGYILGISNDGYGNAWVCTSAHDLLRIQEFPLQVIYHHRFETDVEYVVRLKPFGYLVQCGTGLYRLDTAANKLIHMPQKAFRETSNLSIGIESDSTMWVYRGRDELTYYTPSGEQSFNYIFKEILQQNFYVKVIFCTRNYLWMGTDYGLLKASITSDNVRHYSVGTNTERSVRGMCEDSGKNLYFASYSGLYKIPYPYQPQHIVPVLTKKQTGFTPYSLLYDKGNVWIGTEGVGIARLNLADGTLTRFPEDKAVFKKQFVISLCPNPANPQELIAGTYRGVSRINKETGRFTQVPLHYGGISLDDEYVHQVSLIGKNYWLCTGKGLFQCDQNLVPVRHYPLNNYLVYCIVNDSIRNVVWVGTRGGGLYAVSPEGTVINYTVKDGLADNNVAGIVLDGNTLWVATFNGLSEFNPEKHSFVNLYTSDGLSHDEFNHGASFVTSTGQIFMGGLNGYNLVNNFSAKGDTLVKPPAPFIASLYLLNGQTEIQYYNAKSIPELFVPRNNKVIELEFGLADYDQPENNIYAYKLEGVDQDWVYLGNRNYLRITELRPGAYKLYVKAAGSNGKWRVMSYALNIAVDGFFYTRWWFLLLVTLVLATGITWYFRNRIGRSVPDGEGTAGNHLPVLPYGTRGKLSHNHGATTLGQADADREVSWNGTGGSIDPGTSPYKDLVDRMDEYLDAQFGNTATQYEFIRRVEARKNVLDAVTHQNIYLIFKEAVHNIAKYSDATVVQVALILTDRSLNMTISNNGNATGPSGGEINVNSMEMRARQMRAGLMINPHDHYNLSLIKFF